MDSATHQKDIMKQIDNETFKKYLKNKDNIMIMKSACKQFHRYIPEDDLDSCQQVGLWLAMAKHNGRTKFTSYLYNYVRWECLNYMKYNLNPEHSVLDDVLENIEAPVRRKGMPFSEIIDNLPEIEQNIVTQYIVEQKTFKEIGRTIGKSHETARKHYNRAIDRMRRHFKSFPPV